MQRQQPLSIADYLKSNSTKLGLLKLPKSWVFHEGTNDSRTIAEFYDKR